jgi:hypothetical protein
MAVTGLKKPTIVTRATVIKDEAARQLATNRVKAVLTRAGTGRAGCRIVCRIRAAVPVPIGAPYLLRVRQQETDDGATSGTSSTWASHRSGAALEEMTEKINSVGKVETVISVDISVAESRPALPVRRTRLGPSGCLSKDPSHRNQSYAKTEKNFHGKEFLPDKK